MSIKVEVIFYSMHGHVHKLAEAVVEGAKQVYGTEVSLDQVSELIPDDVLEKHGAKAAKVSFAKVPMATVDRLPDAHAIILERPPASATWLPRCGISSIKQERYGGKVC